VAKLSKRMKAIAAKIDRDKSYSVDDAVKLLNEVATTKFKESIDVAINLGVDPRKSDQAVRGATTLPHGTGKVTRVAVFAQGANVDKAKAAGADLVGFEDLAEQIKGGELNFDVVIATPDAIACRPEARVAWRGDQGCRCPCRARGRRRPSCSVPSGAWNLESLQTDHFSSSFSAPSES